MQNVISNPEILNPILSQMLEAVNSEASVFIVDPSLKKFIDCNDIAINTLGYSREQLLRMGMQDIDATFTHEMIAAAFESPSKQ
jgi:hypothetical protein